MEWELENWGSFPSLGVIGFFEGVLLYIVRDSDGKGELRSKFFNSSYKYELTNQNSQLEPNFA
jgi:hypothetical protein